MEFTGKVKHIWELKTLDNWKQAQDFIIEDDAQYPNTIICSQYDKSISFFKNISVWDEVTVHINLKANEYNGKFYQRISVWRLSSTSAENKKALQSIEIDDLPF